MQKKKKKLLTLLLEGDGKMMKRLLVLMLVFGMASLANAGVIDVVAVDVGQSGGRLGGEQDRLEESDTIGIQIILNHNPYDPAGGTFPNYDGYVLDTMDLDLHVSGAGTLDVPGIFGAKTPFPRIGDDLLHHAGWDVWSQSGASDGTPEGYQPLIVGNSIEKLTGGSFGYILGSQPPNGTGPAVPPTALVWNLFLHCDGGENVIIDLTLRGGTHYWDYSNPQGGPFGDSRFAVEGDLGDLTIHQVPEPATIALLGLGGLFLRRRRK